MNIFNKIYFKKGRKEIDNALFSPVWSQSKSEVYVECGYIGNRTSRFSSKA